MDIGTARMVWIARRPAHFLQYSSPRRSTGDNEGREDVICLRGHVGVWRVFRRRVRGLVVAGRTLAELAQAPESVREVLASLQSANDAAHIASATVALVDIIL